MYVCPPNPPLSMLRKISVWQKRRRFPRTTGLPGVFRGRIFTGERGRLGSADRKTALPEFCHDPACSSRLHMPERTAEHRVIFPDELICTDRIGAAGTISNKPVRISGSWNDAVRATESEPEGLAGLRTRTLQAAERDRTAVPKTQELLAHLHAVQQVRRNVLRAPELHSHRRNGV